MGNLCLHTCNHQQLRQVQACQRFFPSSTHRGANTKKIWAPTKCSNPLKCDNYKVCTVHVGPLQINGFKLTGITRTQQAGQGEQQPANVQGGSPLVLEDVQTHHALHSQTILTQRDTPIGKQCFYYYYFLFVMHGLLQPLVFSPRKHISQQLCYTAAASATQWQKLSTECCSILNQECN